jgi:hypothetical protein
MWSSHGMMVVFLKTFLQWRTVKESSVWIRIRNPDPDPGEQKLPIRTEKSRKISCFEELDVIFLWLKASPVAWSSFTEDLG